MTCNQLPRLSYCFCGDQAIFLDLAADRYFMLSSYRNREFREMATGKSCEPETQHSVISRLNGGATPCLPLDAPPHNSTPMPKTTANPVYLARAVTAYIAAATRLKGRGLSAVLQEAAHRRPSSRHQSSASGYDPIAAAFHTWAPIIGRAENCLPRSIAFHAMALAAGLSPSLVIGVKRDPFSAHAWVQDGARVVNDSAEHVRIFTPILVI
jgi:hypothetical protein